MNFDLLNKLKSANLHNTKYSIKRDAFYYLVKSMSIISFAAILLYGFLIEENNILMIISASICFIISHICRHLINRLENLRKLSIAFILYTEFILLPVFTIFGSYTSSSTPLWFATSVVLMLIILELKDFWWMFIIVFYFETFLYVRTFVFNGANALIVNRLNFFIGFAFSFLGISAASIYYLSVAERRYNQTKVAIEKAREKERNAGLAKSRFLTNMSHEIRTPMNSIIGLSELALKEDCDDNTRVEINVIKNSAYDLLEIIDDVLMVSKLDSGSMKLLNVDFKFDEILKSVIDTISSNIADKNLKVRIKIDHDIPKVVNGDDIRIKQIIMRLVFISLSLTENGRLMLEVHCTRNATNELAHFEITVADTGCGLSKVDLDAIYGAYDIYDSRQKSNLKGIGLKFSICQELLKLMGGSLEVDSIESVGLTSKIKFDLGITNPEPMICIENFDSKNVLIYANDDRELASWKAIMEGFKIIPIYVNNYFSFDKAIANQKFDYIFAPSEVYPSIANIIESYKAYENTYILGYSSNSFGDFDKCRMIRHPVSCLSVVEVLNNKWNIENYFSKTDSVEYDGSKAHILVVDDNTVNLKVAAGIFKAYRIDISMAKSGLEALKLLDENTFDLVLMDMVMPEMSGEDTLKRMRESANKITREVPVIALTANTGGNIREEILAKGFQEYLAKPIKTRYLTQTLLQFLPPGTLKKLKNGKSEAVPARQENVKQVKAEASGAHVKSEPSKEALTPKLYVFEGLKSMGGNEEMYIKILNTYFKEGLQKLKNVPKSWEDKDISLFITNVHGIKSTSASIGAKELAEEFKSLEFAGKDNNLSFIEEHFSEYMTHYKDNLRQVKAYLEAKNAFMGEKYNKEKENTLSSEQIQNLKNSIKQMDLVNIPVAIKEYMELDVQDSIKKKLKEMEEAFKFYDFHKLNEIIDTF